MKPIKNMASDHRRVTFTAVRKAHPITRENMGCDATKSIINISTV
jgi:hypothetical protein